MQNEYIVRMLLRVSTKRQTDAEGDLPTQRNLVRNYIEKQAGWKLDEEKPEYFEGGISGFKNSVSDRKALQEILEDAKRAEFHVLVCYKDDRLGRREDEIPQYIKKLAEFGVLVYTVKDGCITPETHADDLLTYIRYWHAEGASRDTGLRVKDAAIELVKQGRNQGGNAPFGYELVYSGELSKHKRALKKKVIVPQAAEVVRFMYDLALSHGYGAYKITKQLNKDEAVRAMSPNGKEWKAVTVSDILKNPIYTGYEAYNRRIHEGEHYKKLDREHWVLSEEHKEELAIIDLDTWEKVQRIRESRKEKYQGEREQEENVPICTTGVLALLDVAYCGCCGRKLTNGSKYNYWQTKAKEKRSSIVGYYRCQTKHQGGSCNGKGLYRADSTEPMVFDYIKDYLEFLEDNGAVVEKIKETSKKQKRLKKEKIQKLEQSLTEIQKDIGTLKGNLPKVLRGEMKLPPELFYEQIEEKEHKMQQAQEKLKDLKAVKEKENREDLELEYFIAQVPKWRDAFDHAEVSAKRMVINKLIRRIDIKENEISIEFRVNLDEFLSRKTIYQRVPEQGV
jgi:DNA invertase Pin-like site-specific DNA recombinase